MPCWKFFIETHGCKVNQSESQMLREAWLGLGGEEAAAPAEADFILINSCAITANAERESRNAMNRLKSQAPQARIILTGCAAQLFPGFRPRKNTAQGQPAIIVAQRHKATLLAGPEKAAYATPEGMFASLRGFQRSRPVIKIQDGCSYGCSYCIVPQTRGAPSSRSAEAILAECRNLLAAGYAEVIISGVNLSLYADARLGGFWNLLAWLDSSLSPEFAQSARLRASSLWPAQLTAQGVETLATARMVCPHLHLSLQHASPAVLESMGRSASNPEKIANAVEQLRKTLPMLGLGADIITGHPGETEADIDCLSRYIEEIGLNAAHIFPFSARPGTKAATMPNQIPKQIKLARANRLRAQIARQKKDFLIRQTRLPLVFVAAEGASGSAIKGVNQFYSECVFNEPAPVAQGLVAAAPVAAGDGVLIVKPV